MLGQGSAHEQAAVAAALDGQLFRRSVLAVDEVLGAGGEVIKDILLVCPAAGLVPLFAVFAAAAQVGHDPNAALVEPDPTRAGKSGLLAAIEAAVAGQERRIAAVPLRPLALDDVEWNLG